MPLELIIKTYNVTSLFFLAIIGVVEIILIAAIILLLFGGKKIPEMMKGIGKGVKGFKDEVNGGEERNTENETREPDGNTDLTD